MKIQIINRIIALICFFIIPCTLKSADGQKWLRKQVEISRCSLELPKNTPGHQYCTILQRAAVFLSLQDELYDILSSMQSERYSRFTKRKSVQDIINNVLATTKPTLESNNTSETLTEHIVKVFTLCTFAQQKINQCPELNVPALEHLNWIRTITATIKLGTMIMQKARSNSLTVDDIQRYANQINNKLCDALEEYANLEIAINIQYQEIITALRKEIYHQTKGRNQDKAEEFDAYLLDFTSEKDGGPYQLPDNLLQESEQSSAPHAFIPPKIIKSDKNSTQPPKSMEKGKTSVSKKVTVPATRQKNIKTSIIARPYDKSTAYIERDSKVVYVRDPENNMDITINCENENLTYSDYPATTLIDRYGENVKQAFTHKPTEKEVKSLTGRRNLQQKRFSPLVDSLLRHASEYLETNRYNRQTLLCLDKSTPEKIVDYWVHKAPNTNTQLRVELDAKVQFTQEKEVRDCTFEYLIDPKTHKINHRIMKLHKKQSK